MLVMQQDLVTPEMSCLKLVITELSTTMLIVINSLHYWQTAVHLHMCFQKKALSTIGNAANFEIEKIIF